MKIQQLKSSEIPELKKLLLKEQNNICPICDREINAPVLDHHHKKRIKGTGLVRGILCRSCNVLLGKVENNCVRYSISQTELPNVLRNMASYLEQKQLPYMHPSEAPKKKKLTKTSYKKLVKLINGAQKIPEYPKSGTLTKSLRVLYEKYNLTPKFYA